MMNNKNKIIFFDIETTGLNVKTERIVELAMIKFEGKEIKKWSYLINPNKIIPKKVIEIHHITNDMVKNEKTFDELGFDIIRFISDYRLAGWNSDKFDIPFLQNSFDRYGIVVEPPLKRRPNLDVKLLYRQLEQPISYVTLEKAYKKLTGEDLKGAHRAINDVEATIAIFDKLYEKHNLQKYNSIDEIIKIYKYATLRRYPKILK